MRFHIDSVCPKDASEIYAIKYPFFGYQDANYWQLFSHYSYGKRAKSRLINLGSSTRDNRSGD